MSSLYQSFYSDVIKDVIGNDPVLDQFDTFYEASFYGTMQDDFITGSILSVSTRNISGLNRRYIFTGSRGRLLSKYYADSAPPVESTYGSEEANNNPWLSYRLVPWSERTSTTSYRFNQHFDPNERYYDSCLPDLNNCFSANGSKPWIVKNESETLLSPYNNCQLFSGIANLVFNYPSVERENYSSDPAVDNSWTWSYPFESRYKPEKRILGFNESFGLSPVNTYADISFVKPEQIYPRYGEFWESSGIKSFSIDSVSEGLSKNVQFFRPILPGKNFGRNPFRQTLTNEYFGSNGFRSIIPAWYSDPSQDSKFGYSVLIPADVNISIPADHGFLAEYGISDPGLEFLTSSMMIDDTIKLLFGFGDQNTITFLERLSFDPSNSSISHEEGFETTAADSPSTSVPYFENQLLKLNWDTAGYPNSNRWKVVTEQGFTASSEFFFSGPGSSAGNPLIGVSWEVDLTAGGMNILYSNTSTSFDGDMSNTGDDSYMHLDITASCPWSFGFNFSLVSDAGGGDYFRAWLTGSSYINPIGLLDTSDNEAPDNFFYVSEDGSEGYPVTQTSLPGVLHTPPGTPPSRSGGNYDWNTHGAKDINTLGQPYFTGSNEYPIPAGEHRLVFHYRLGGTASVVSFAAVDRLSFRLYDESCFPENTTSKRIGCNNYPKFKIIDSDSRSNQTYKFNVDSGWNPDYMQEKTSDIYSGIKYGISPEIRGWKYGLHSGLPVNSKAVFRRDKFGHFRDMLEQRQYTRFINVNSSIADNDAITRDSYNNQIDSRLKLQKDITTTGPSVAEVNFVRQRYKKDERGIGYIYNEKVDPRLTISQNLSPEVTSSIPYFDGEAKLRQEEDLLLITDATLTSLQFGPNGLTVT